MTFSISGRSIPPNAAQRARALGRGVERRDDRPLGGQQRQHRDADRGRLVQVQHVEGVLGEPAPRPGVASAARTSPAPPSRCRARRSARPAGVTNSGTGVSVGGRGQHAHRVPEPLQRAGEPDDVRLHPARDVEGVRADDPHPQRARQPVTAAARSAVQIGCSACQSCGRLRDERRRARRRSPAWPSRPTAARGPPAPGRRSAPPSRPG